MLKSLVNKQYTVVVYESVHRIEKTLSELEEYLGSDFHIVVGREITKKFEEFKRGTISDVRDYYPRRKAVVSAWSAISKLA